jgi:hypothetical protein
MRRWLGLAVGLAVVTSCSVRSGPAPLEPVGEFSFETVVNGQPADGRIVIEGSSGDYTGQVVPNWGVPAVPIVDVVVEDPNITVVADWGAEDLVIYMTFTGDTYTGEWVMGFDGGDITGARVTAEEQ